MLSQVLGWGLLGGPSAVQQFSLQQRQVGLEKKRQGLPLHSPTELVSQYKWPLLPPPFRVEIRRRRDLQAEASLRNEKVKGTTLEVSGATD